MAIGDPYVTLTQLKSYLKIGDTVDDSELSDALAAASRGITDFCKRQFNKETSATARVYRVTRSGLAMVDDFHTITGLVIATGVTGVFDTTWVASDYELEPLNGVRNGEPGWPYWKIRSLDSSALSFTASDRATLQVTAQWGWAAVPTQVKQACLILAAENFKLKDAPFGVAGFDGFGAVRVRDNAMAKSKLVPYRRNAVLVA